MYWSLLGKKDEKEIIDEMKEFENKWKEKIKAKIIKRNVLLSKVIAGAFSLIAIVTLIINLFIQIDVFFGISLFLAIIGIGILFGIKEYYKNMLSDYLKLQIAKEKKWLYSPNKKKNELIELEKRIPRIFKKGNTFKKYVENQFYGKLNIKEKDVPFHFGDFYYQINSGSGKNSRTTPYFKHFFAFKNPKQLNASFLMAPEGMFSKLGNIFTKKDVNLESNNFNKEFAFDYKGNKSLTKKVISKIMTPSTQLKFIKLEKRKKDFSVLFEKKFTVFLFDKFLVENIKTDLTKSLEINKEDRKNIEDKISDATSIMEEIVEIFR
jgi:hypothetical protein